MAVAPAESTTARTVVLVVVAPAPVPVVVLQPGRDKMVVLPVRQMVVAVVVALAILVKPQAARTMLVTVARVYHFTPCIERVVAEEEAVRRTLTEAAPMRALAVMAAAVTAVPAVSPLTEVVPAAPQTVPRTPASLAALILVAEVVAEALVAYRQDSQIPVLVGPALLLLGISQPRWQRPVVPKPPRATIPYTPSTPVVHLRLLVLRQ